MRIYYNEPNNSNI